MIPAELKTLIEDHRYQATKKREQGLQLLAEAGALSGAAEALERRCKELQLFATQEDAYHHPEKGWMTPDEFAAFIAQEMSKQALGSKR